jgi:hypothetical protein
VEGAEFFPIILATELVGTFVDMLLQKCKRDVAMERFFRLVGKPTKLILAHEHMSSLKFLNDQLDTFKVKMMDGLTQLRDAADNTRIPDDPASRAMMAKLLRDGAMGMLVGAAEGLKGYAARRGVPAAYTASDQYLEDVPSLRLATLWQELLTPYFRAVVDTSQMRRTLRGSDIADFLHALYIPHCAVWRSDRYFANLAAPVAKRFGCRVVSRLLDLPKVLNEILAADDDG